MALSLFSCNLLVVTKQKIGDDVRISLDKNRMGGSLAWGYFWMLMTACRTKEGLRLLEKSNVFDILFRLAELSDRSDIHREILTSMDYSKYYLVTNSSDGFPRTILSKMLSVESTVVSLVTVSRKHGCWHSLSCDT